MGKSRIPQELFDQVVAKSDIVDVISDYVQLSKAGKTIKGYVLFTGKTPLLLLSRQIREFINVSDVEKGEMLFLSSPHSKLFHIRRQF